jgi:uncharacterized protein YkwD
MASFPTTNPRPWHAAHDAMLLCAALCLCGAGLAFSLQRSPAVAQIMNDGLPTHRTAEPRVVPLSDGPAVAGIRTASVAPVAAPAVSEEVAAVPPPAPTFYLPAVPDGPVSAAERSILAATNTARAQQGLAPLVADEALTHLARVRAQQMADQGYFGHVDTAGYTMYTELLAFTGSRYKWAGENLALNDFPITDSPVRAFAALMQSPDHRANILAADYSRVGIGELTTADGRHIYAMIFIG